MDRDENKIGKVEEPLSLKIVSLRDNAVMPEYATSGSAGMDLRACITVPVSIIPRELVTIPTGIALALPSRDYVALIFARSGLGVKHGITLSNGVGVIDSDYRGELFVGLCNHSSKSYKIMPNDRIAQLIVTKIEHLPILTSDALDQTQRGCGGLGSTGKK